jgi:hypothetical protein
MMAFLSGPFVKDNAEQPAACPTGIGFEFVRARRASLFGHVRKVELAFRNMAKMSRQIDSGVEVRERN